MPLQKTGSSGPSADRGPTCGAFVESDVSLDPAANTRKSISSPCRASPRAGIEMWIAKYCTEHPLDPMAEATIRGRRFTLTTVSTQR
jgi:hypothetical protein